MGLDGVKVRCLTGMPGHLAGDFVDLPFRSVVDLIGPIRSFSRRLPCQKWTTTCAEFVSGLSGGVDAGLIKQPYDSETVLVYVKCKVDHPLTPAQE